MNNNIIVTPGQFYHNVKIYGYEKIIDSIPYESIDLIVPHEFKMVVLNLKQTLDGIRNMEKDFIK